MGVTPMPSRTLQAAVVWTSPVLGTQLVASHSCSVSVLSTSTSVVSVSEKECCGETLALVQPICVVPYPEDLPLLHKQFNVCVLLLSSPAAADFQLYVSCPLGFLSKLDSWTRWAPPSAISTWESPGRRSEEPLVSPPLFTVVRFPLFTVFLWEAGQSGPAVLFRQSG